MKKYIFAAVLVGLVAGTAAVSPPSRPAMSASTKTFGGPILQKKVCDCNGKFWILVGNPVSAAIIINPATTKIYKYGQYFREGANVLGTYSSGGDCKYIVGDHCNIYPSDGTAEMIGTSQ